MYAELVFPPNSIVEEYTRDLVRVITASDGAGGANTSILEFADQGLSTVVDTVASEWTLDPAFTLPTGPVTTADLYYIINQPHQNGSTKSVIVGNVNQNPSSFNQGNLNVGTSIGMVWNRGAADQANYMAYSGLGAQNYTSNSANYGRYSHCINTVENTTLVVWAQPRSVGIITTCKQASGNVIEAGFIAIVENVDTYESSWRGTAYPMQAKFSDLYLPLQNPSAGTSTQGDNYKYYAMAATGGLYPYSMSTRWCPRVLFQNTFWDRGNDRFMSMTYHEFYPSQHGGSHSSSGYAPSSNFFGFWYLDEADSLGLGGFTLTDGNASASYPYTSSSTLLGSNNLPAWWTGPSNTYWSTDMGNLIYSRVTHKNYWIVHTPRDANGDPAVVLTPVVYRVGEEARYQDYSSEAGFYFASPNFKDSEHMYYKFLTDGNGDTFLLFYSDYSTTASEGGYAIKVS